MHGSSWAEIGAALGVTRRAAQQRFLAPAREYDPSEFSAQLGRGVAADVLRTAGVDTAALQAGRAA